jgi:hypothetical protein
MSYFHVVMNFLVRTKHKGKSNHFPILRTVFFCVIAQWVPVIRYLGFRPNYRYQSFTFFTFCCPFISAPSSLITNLTHFSHMSISVLYMFWTAVCPSSGELIVSVRHLVYVTLCRWPSGTHTRRSSTQSDTNQVSHWYNNSPDDGHMAARNM